MASKGVPSARLPWGALPLGSCSLPPAMTLSSQEEVQVLGCQGQSLSCAPFPLTMVGHRLYQWLKSGQQFGLAEEGQVSEVCPLPGTFLHFSPCSHVPWCSPLAQCCSEMPQSHLPIQSWVKGGPSMRRLIRLSPSQWPLALAALPVPSISWPGCSWPKC